MLLQGSEGEWDETGVWDPYVIYEDGLFKMWYGGGGGRNPNYGWAYAESEDGIHWQAKNKRLIYGLDADVLQVTDDLYLMVYAPENHFDKNDADMRIAIYNGSLAELASTPPFIEVEEPGSLVGKKFEVPMGDDPSLTLTFRIDGEVVLSEESNEEDPWIFNAYYILKGDSVLIMGEDFDLKCTYDGENLNITE